MISKITRKLVVLVLALTVSFNLAVTSYAVSVEITDYEIESNNNIGDENIIKIGPVYHGRVDMPEDEDRFAFVGEGKNVEFIFIKQPSDPKEYSYFILDDTTGEYVKYFTSMSSNIERLKFKAEEYHIYILLIYSEDYIPSTPPYQIMFFNR